MTQDRARARGPRRTGIRRYVGPVWKGSWVGSATRRCATANSIQLLKNGPDTYDDWLGAIARAQRWIHLDNFIFANDEIGNRFAEALSAKAKEGVRVRVLHDWFGCMNVPRSFWRGAGGWRAHRVGPRRFGAAAGRYSPRPPRCWQSTASTPRRAACASPMVGWSAPRRRGCPTGTPPSA